MHIYPAQLQLCEHTFFASREIGTLYETEPLIGNYALTYALGLAQSPYRLEGSASGPRYRADLSRLNEAGLYLTPAEFGYLRMALTQFNGQTDSYYFRFSQNAIAATRDPVKAMNFPQSGRIRMLGVGQSGSLLFVRPRSSAGGGQRAAPPTLRAAGQVYEQGPVDLGRPDRAAAGGTRTGRREWPA